MASMVLVITRRKRKKMVNGKHFPRAAVRALSAEEIERISKSGAYIPVGIRELNSDGSRRLIKGANDRQPIIRGSSAPPVRR